MKETFPEIRIENGRTLADVILREPVSEKVAVRVSDFCKRNSVERPILTQDGSGVKSFPDGKGGTVDCPESFECDQISAILGLGGPKYGKNYILSVEGEDEFSESYVERIYSMLPTVDMRVI
ncbi:hypothetical protein HOD88_03480 [archaeon]|mgnify:CR=1 FL=1|jgi:hypothetical protein|nr:hypothetical protein [archaeon]